MINKASGLYPSNIQETFNNFEDQLENVGIFSLSKNPCNQLMWTHYSGESTGLSLGFNLVSGSKLADSYYCLPVVYSDKLPEFSDSDFEVETTICMSPMGQKSAQKISFGDRTFRSAITTKATCWSYEEEWRYIEEKGGSFDFPASLEEIIFGLNCTRATKDKYVKLAENTSITQSYLSKCLTLRILIKLKLLNIN